MTPDEIAAKLMMLTAIGIAWFTAGATTLAAEITHAVLGAQVNDSLLVGVALFALTTGTAIFAWVFKLLLQVKDGQTRTDTRLDDLEARLDRWEA